MSNQNKKSTEKKYYTELPTEGFKNCIICNAESDGYAFCKDCWKENDDEALLYILNDYANGHKCIICDKDAPNGPHCKDCYYEMLDYKDQFDKNMKLYEFRDYYYNLKNNIYRMYDYEKIKTNCNKLYAMAQLTEDLFDTNELTAKVGKDIINILKDKKPKSNEPQQTNKHILKSDSVKEEIFRTEDGHNVKSLGEKNIDDILYASRIAHAYSIDVSEIDTRTDRAIQCDWFIPVLGSNQGIYIEYWGINNKKDYNENKEEKIKIYEKYDLPLISIEKDEINDTQSLKSRIRRELKELAKRYYKTEMNF